MHGPDAAEKEAKLQPTIIDPCHYFYLSHSSIVFCHTTGKGAVALCSATQKEAVWRGPDNKPCLPKHFFPHFAKLTHRLNHVSKGGMMDAITQHWFTKGFSVHAAEVLSTAYGLCNA